MIYVGNLYFSFAFTYPLSGVVVFPSFLPIVVLSWTDSLFCGIISTLMVVLLLFFANSIFPSVTFDSVRCLL